VVRLLLLLFGGCGAAFAFAAFDFILEACQLCVCDIYLYLFYTLTELFVIYVWKFIKLIWFAFLFFSYLLVLKKCSMKIIVVYKFKFFFICKSQMSLLEKI